MKKKIKLLDFDQLQLVEVIEESIKLMFPIEFSPYHSASINAHFFYYILMGYSAFRIN
ncbi:hypothetical protein GMMP13_1490003 [Candidatus Magnetomoraceae bacterium gMMP-13]